MELGPVRAAEPGKTDNLLTSQMLFLIVAGQMPMAGFGMPGAGFGAAGRMGMPGMAPQTGTSVILVSNLDEEVRLHQGYAPSFHLPQIPLVLC